ncbi:MAG: hypothetical protein LBG76_01810 [Treponema sp.]|jgi:hypothetical protein|nr:hypothetical protein [Treponema sp.]
MILLKRGGLIPLFIRRGAVFFFIMDCFTLFLYGLGARQRFMDATQSMLLGLASGFSLSLILMAICGVSITLRRLFRREQRRFVLELGLYALLSVFGVLTALFAGFILVFSRGNGG